MEGLSKWLYDISWPIVSRVLAALGLGTITYTGADTALTAAMSAAKATLTGIIPEVLQILAMSGFFEAMAISAGGLISGLAWMVLKRFALSTTGPAA
jgi:Protein of unknown function (DUF2523)